MESLEQFLKESLEALEKFLKQFPKKTLEEFLKQSLENLGFVLWECWC